MPREFRIAGKRRRRRRNAPAFVVVAVFGRRADRERRHLVEEEIQPVVVVEHDGDVGTRRRRATRAPAESRRRTASSTDRAAGPCAIALPMAGTCDVVMPPTILATFILPPDAAFALNASTRHPGLLRPDSWTSEAEDPGELGQVVDVAAGGEQFEHVAPADRPLLFVVQAESVHVGFFAGHEGLAIGLAVERETHLVERVAFHRFVPVEEDRARDRLLEGGRHALRVRAACYHSRKNL